MNHRPPEPIITDVHTVLAMIRLHGYSWTIDKSAPEAWNPYPPPPEKK